MSTPPRIGTNLYVSSIMTTEEVHVALQSVNGFARLALQLTGTSPDETDFVYANGCQIVLAVTGAMYINTAAEGAVPTWVLVGGGGTNPTVQVDNLTIISNTATLSSTPIAIIVASSNGGVLAPGTGNDYTQGGTGGKTITTPNIASGPLLVVYFK